MVCFLSSKSYIKLLVCEDVISNIKNIQEIKDGKGAGLARSGPKSPCLGQPGFFGQGGAGGLRQCDWVKEVTHA